MSWSGGGSAISGSGSGDILGFLKGYVEKARSSYEVHFNKILMNMGERILSRTPVWEGDVVHNWRWSVNTPDVDYDPAIPTPVDPGHTNRMSLGSEPRRAVNEARSRASLAKVLLTRKPVDVYLTNPSEHSWELEYGQLPTPQSSRTPAGGIVRLVAKEAASGIT